MTLTELRYIVALAHENHFGRAAEKCHVAQPTLSVAVKKLEDSLGIVLFERNSGEVRLTAIGAQIVAQAERVLSEAARVSEIAATGRDPLVGPLRLGVIYTIGPWLLPALVPILKQRAPKMPLIIAEGYTEVLVEKLKNFELDVLVLALPVNEPGIVAQPVYDEPFRLLLPVAHPWVKQKMLATSQLLEEPLLMLGPGNCFRDQVLDLCARASHGQSPQVLESSSLETIRHMVASGVGVTVMPASSVDTLAKNDPLLRVRPFTEPTPTRRVGLVWRASFPRHQAIDIMRAALLDCHLPGTRPIR
ncbi:LysR family transcriptional regulator [Rugosibacter aromaticivorans]|uniref:LysR family transcriptional regulator n=1 Tax=Rugosibacter aromaticivorans TaxID=1565605 RepID=A0A0C5JBH0_9PROT|nr:hydrogen peroxide-inducible genes activator [Rugosibacter aromaticivorans]AJP49089.1 LysR family transcriptional regulator [Rugosibacter aromaticivorans]TBR15759.1 MAG: hydrogen peroxide-inducible genes activator [Rugosibacter sp.]